jgi:hypothetical protein
MHQNANVWITEGTYSSVISAADFLAFKSVLRIHEILVLIRICRPIPLTNDPDPAIFVSVLQDVN